MSSKDNLGDKLKDLEQIEAGRKVMKGLPVMARLDGRSFSKFTKGLKRPYDDRMSQLMIDTTKYLVKETQACVGYCQSDEITLCWYFPYESTSEYMFDGKYQKLVSTLSAMATAFFNKNLSDRIPEKADQLPTFDCRVWQVPTLREVYLNFLWREQDATKNSISMAAHHYFPHNDLIGKTGVEKQALLLSDRDVNWNDYPTFFKRGTYVQRKNFAVELDVDTLSKIPEGKRPLGGVVVRSRVVELDMPILSTVANASSVLVYGDEPVLKGTVGLLESSQLLNDIE
jgi:tRNA(His) guanylyltransferase